MIITGDVEEPDIRKLGVCQVYKKLYDVIRDDLRNQNRCKIVEIDRDEEM